jgi:hypothetical protein
MDRCSPTELLAKGRSMQLGDLYREDKNTFYDQCLFSKVVEDGIERNQIQRATHSTNFIKNELEHLKMSEGSAESKIKKHKFAPLDVQIKTTVQNKKSMHKEVREIHIEILTVQERLNTEIEEVKKRMIDVKKVSDLGATHFVKSITFGASCNVAYAVVHDTSRSEQNREGNIKVGDQIKYLGGAEAKSGLVASRNSQKLYAFTSLSSDFSGFSDANIRLKNTGGTATEQELINETETELMRVVGKGVPQKFSVLPISYMTPKNFVENRDKLQHEGDLKPLSNDLKNIKKDTAKIWDVLNRLKEHKDYVNERFIEGAEEMLESLKEFKRRQTQDLNDFQHELTTVTDALATFTNTGQYTGSRCQQAVKDFLKTNSPAHKELSFGENLKVNNVTPVSSYISNHQTEYYTLEIPAETRYESMNFDDQFRLLKNIQVERKGESHVRFHYDFIQAPATFKTDKYNNTCERKVQISHYVAGTLVSSNVNHVFSFQGKYKLIQADKSNYNSYLHDLGEY